MKGFQSAALLIFRGITDTQITDITTHSEHFPVVLHDGNIVNLVLFINVNCKTYCKTLKKKQCTAQPYSEGNTWFCSNTKVYTVNRR